MQAKMLNIPSYLEDPSYRYKMPALVLKIEGRGNGIKTKIVNLADIATALRVPSAYPLKFLGHELGSQTNESQAVINGSFVEPEVRKHLDKFIEKYVLCSNCKYPEMDLKIKHGQVSGSCNACGTRSTLDNAHKIAAYILKNPPKRNEIFTPGAKDTKDAKDGKDGKEVKKEEKADDKKIKHDKNQDAHQGKENKEEQKDEDGNTETKKEKEPSGVTGVTTFKEIGVAYMVEEDLVTKVNNIYKQHAGVERFDDHPELVKKIITETRKIVPEDHANKIPYILFHAIFDVNIAKEVGKNKAIFTQAYEELQTRDVELDTLLNLERFLLLKNNAFVFEKYVPTILKLFYDDDFLTEEFLIDWHEGKLNSKLIMDFRYLKNVDEKFKAAAKPFINWLK